MLPFLKNKIKSGSGVIIKERAPDTPTEETVEDSIEHCVDRLLKAIEQKDKQAIVEAIRDVHDELHLEMDEKSNSYDEQNQEAAKEE